MDNPNPVYLDALQSQDFYVNRVVWNMWREIMNYLKTWKTGQKNRESFSFLEGSM